MPRPFATSGPRPRARLGLLLGLSLTMATVASPSSAPAQPDGYRLPPAEIVRILDAPPPPRAVPSPRGDALALVDYEPYPPIAQLARPILRLAGLRLDPKGGHRQRLVRYTGLSVQPLDGGPARRIALPEGARIGMPSWSHDGRKLAFARDLDDGVELWVADVATGAARAIPGARLNDILGDPFDWESDNRHLLVRLVPGDRGPAPATPLAPAGPSVRESIGKTSQAPTYQDLLKSPHDEALFAHFALGQLARVDPEATTPAAAVATIGAPGLIAASSPSPDGRFLLVTTLRRPFSYRVPSGLFSRTTAVWDATTGQPLATIADLPVSDDIPRQGVVKGPRGAEWQPLRPARVLWAEALDDGDPTRKVPHRDRLMALDAPFTAPPRELLQVQHRFRGLAYLPEADDVLLTEFDRDRRWTTTYRLNLAEPAASKSVLFDRSVNDAYGDPGSPVDERRPDGTVVVLRDGTNIYLAGAGAAAGGARPFLDRRDLASGQTTRLFQAEPERYETFLDFVGDGRERILISSQSRTEPPNYVVVDLESGARTPITHFTDPAPELTRVQKELITYDRGDGVPLSGTLYLPADYQPGTRLPLLVWAYPLEYSDPATAGQVRTSPHTFLRPTGASHLFFVTQGYAVLDDATMPVVGDPDTMNDTFIPQITAAAKAAIDVLDRRGVIDPKRVAVAGHSYGGFMTANLLAHTDLFAAGIARSGAYNRTLTPFGFQSERRSFWEAPDVYLRLSPFAHADKIQEPLLLIHGEVDDNTGTYPIQSERLFEAIQGHGGTTRLVMLPHESHGYRGRESILHVLAEMLDWADRYVKNRPATDGR